MRRLAVLLIVIAVLTLSLILTPTPALAGFYCDLTDLFVKYSTAWYAAWTACVAELILESETGRYW